MEDRKPKVIKKKTLEEIDEAIFIDEVSLFRNLFRRIKTKKPEKAREVLQELRAEVC